MDGTRAARVTVSLTSAGYPDVSLLGASTCGVAILQSQLKQVETKKIFGLFKSGSFVFPGYFLPGYFLLTKGTVPKHTYNSLTFQTKYPMEHIPTRICCDKSSSILSKALQSSDLAQKCDMHPNIWANYYNS